MKRRSSGINSVNFHKRLDILRARIFQRNPRFSVLVFGALLARSSNGRVGVMSSGKVPAHRGSRLGTFFVGLFAGVCASVFPRLATLIGAPTGGSSSLEMNAFRLPFVIASVAFALLIGFGVMIWEWNVRATPRQIFLAALGLPALFAGALNSVAISSNASHLGQQLESISTQYREANGIPVKDGPPSPISSLRPDFGDTGLIPAAFGGSLGAGRSIAVVQQGGGVD